MRVRFVLVAAVACALASSAWAELVSTDLVSHVDPFVGTAGTGHTFPGPCRPFGLVQPSPETGNASWKYCSGYNHDDTKIRCFAQIRFDFTHGLYRDAHHTAFLAKTASVERVSNRAITSSTSTGSSDATTRRTPLCGGSAASSIVRRRTVFRATTTAVRCPPGISRIKNVWSQQSSDQDNSDCLFLNVI